MTDNDQIKIFLPILTPLADTVVSAYQNSIQGLPVTANSIFFNKVSDKNVGSPHIVIDNGNKTITQRVESVWQLSALAEQGNDLLNTAMLTLYENMEYLSKNGLNLIFISGIRDNYFKDEHERYKQSPSLDFTLIHKNTIITATETTNQIGEKIYGY